MLVRIALVLSLLLSTNLPSTAQIPGDLALTSVASGSTVLAMRDAGDGSNRLFLVERDGSIRIFVPGTGVLATPFLTIGEVDTFFEGGLLGLAFHPSYPSNGLFYVSYTRAGSGGDALETVVARYTVSGDPNIADASSFREVFTLGQPAGNHNGGDIHFGPDGFLYIGLGDGGASSATSQDNDNLLGKMLRIAPCTNAACSPAFDIPGTNPFVGASGADEIWATGLRNPYRFSFDRQTGDLFIADVGAGSREEVNFQAVSSSGGEDYGWNCREGDLPNTGCTGTFVEPVMVYPHSGGNCSITGGYRYRGCIDGLKGKYVFGDFCSGRIWFGTEDTPGNWSFSEWTDLPSSVFGFGEDESGELYISTGGTVSRFDSASSCITDPIFEDGFESGNTAAWTATFP